MTRTLQREDVPEDEKMMLYDQKLQKYMSRYQQYKQDGVQPMVIEKIDSPQKEDLTRQLVLQSVPKTAYSKTEMLMDRLKQVVDWNDRGEFGYKGEPVVPGSNLVDLVGNATRSKSLKHVNPEGMNTFLTALRDVNVPQSWISNKSYLERMRNVASTPLPYTQETPVNRTSRASRIPTPTSRIATQAATLTPATLTPQTLTSPLAVTSPRDATLTPATLTPQILTSPLAVTSPQDATLTTSPNEEESGYHTFSTPSSRLTTPRQAVSDRLLKRWKKYKPSE